MNNSESWEAVIGLETHVQLNTKSKIFTSASTAFGDAPNTYRSCSLWLQELFQF